MNFFFGDVTNTETEGIFYKVAVWKKVLVCDCVFTYPIANKNFKKFL